MTGQKQSSENQLMNLLFNIILPVLILNQLGKRLGENGPVLALLIALSLPIIYALVEYLKVKKWNLFSIIGVINVLLTGGLALLQVEGVWFAIKEMVFPLVIGIGVLISAFTLKPLIKFLVYNPNIMDVDLIESKLKELGSEVEFQKQLKLSTIYLSFSFFLSAVLNLALGLYIFTDIPAGLSELEQADVLNAQIAKMTWMSYIVILVPCMVCMWAIFMNLSKGIEKHTGLNFNQFLMIDKDKA